MNEATEEAMAELLVILGEEDEVVPAFVHHRWRNEVVLVRSTEVEETLGVGEERFGVFFRQVELFLKPRHESRVLVSHHLVKGDDLCLGQCFHELSRCLSLSDL